MHLLSKGKVKRIKAQVTIFLLVGLILLFIVGFVFSLIYSVSKEKAKQNQQGAADINNKAEAMNILVEQCTEDVGKNALVTLGYRAGSDSLTTPFFEGDVISLNYAYYLGEKRVPSVSDMKYSLEKLMNNNIEKCVIDSLDEKDGEYLFQGAFIDAGIPGTDALITESSVIFTIVWPITIQTEGAEKQLEEFTPIEIPVRIKKINLFVDNLMEQFTINPYFIDAFYILDQGFSSDIVLFNNNTSIFIITDNQTIINNEPYRFLFAVKINTSDEG